MNYNKLPKENGKYIKLTNPKVCYDEITNIYKCETKIQVQICDTIEKNIISQVVDYAKENNVTDLILIDEDFVKSALKHEQQLRSPLHQFKSVKKPPTNFDKITQNVDSFVKWVLDNYNSVPAELNCETSCNKDCGECFKNWLLQAAE